ncbi:cellulose binding domain-containing protein [Streptomyces sp. NPDC088553]|uniref:cellulose binding domain-containing protein n=1 Tax=Streptomyces sp. NPDC088553 TaxID=3365864 RepID=UPI00381BA9CE
MNRTRVFSTATLLALAATITSGPVTAQAAERSDGFHVVGGRLVDATGKDFVLRGVNHAHTRYTDRTGQSLADIKALGADSARMVLGYPGWSCSGNGGVEYLDLADGFDADRLTARGERLFHGPDGIRRTSQEAGVHRRGCSIAHRLDERGTGFDADITVRNTGEQPLKGWKLDFTLPEGTTVNSVWNASVTQIGRRVRATGESWTESVPIGRAVSFGVNVAGPGAVPPPSVSTASPAPGAAPRRPAPPHRAREERGPSVRPAPEPVPRLVPSPS